MLRFADIQHAPPGTLASLLSRAYEPLLCSNPGRWRPEEEAWEAFDREAYSSGHVGRCVFLSLLGDVLVGFGSFDPRGIPATARVGHHCILPPYQGRGFGRAQLAEILRRLEIRGAQAVVATTLDIPFFMPAQHAYRSAGFRLAGRTPWEADPRIVRLHFQREPRPDQPMSA